LFSAELEKKNGKFPADGNTTKRYKTKKPEPDFSPFRKAKKTDADITEAVNALFSIMVQPPAKRNTERRSNDPATRALIVTTATWSPDSRARRRDWIPIACWAVLEYYWVRGYRAALFNKIQVARIIRKDLSDLYRPFIISDQMVLTPAVGITTSNEFPWWDMISPIQSDDTMTRISIAEVKMETEASSLWDKYDKEMRKIISMVQRSDVAHNNAGPANSVDSTVRGHLESLLLVSIDF